MIAGRHATSEWGPVIMLLLLWGAFAGLWALIASRYHVHLWHLPVPDVNSLSMSIVALLLYAPPIVMLLVMLTRFRKESAASRALRGLVWVLAGLLIVGLCGIATYFIWD